MTSYPEERKGIEVADVSSSWEITDQRERPLDYYDELDAAAAAGYSSVDASDDNRGGGTGRSIPGLISALVNITTANNTDYDPSCSQYFYNRYDALGDGDESSVAMETTEVDDEQIYNRLRFVVDVFVVTALCAFGFVGNSLSIAVLRRDRLTGRRDAQNACTSCLLQALAGLNTVYLGACLVIQPAKSLVESSSWMMSSPFQRVLAYAEPYVWTLASISQTASVWMLVVVTVDRYIAVCQPFKSHLRTLIRAKLVVVTVAIASVLYNIPSYFERQTVEFICAGNRIVVVRQTALRLYYVYFVVYKTAFYFLFRTAGPLAVLSSLNFRLMVALREMRHRRKRLKMCMSQCSTKKSLHREAVTTMLVAVVTLFIVCELPDLALRITATVIEMQPETLVNVDSGDVVMTSSTEDVAIGASLEQLGPTRAAIRCANSIANCLLTVNSAVSFVVYCAVGRKFRDALRTLFDRRGAFNTASTFAHRSSAVLEPDADPTEKDPLNDGVACRQKTLTVKSEVAVVCAVNTEADDHRIRNIGNEEAIENVYVA